MANTLAYYGTELITAVKSFMIRAPRDVSTKKKNISFFSRKILIHLKKYFHIKILGDTNMYRILNCLPIIPSNQNLSLNISDKSQLPSRFLQHPFKINSEKGIYLNFQLQLKETLKDTLNRYIPLRYLFHGSSSQMLGIKLGGAHRSPITLKGFVLVTGLLPYLTKG